MTSTAPIAPLLQASSQSTTDLAARLWGLLSQRDRGRLALGMALAALLAVLETVSVGMVPLFVLVLQDPERVSGLAAKWLGPAWVPAESRLLAVAAAALVLAYAAKSVLGLAVLAFQARFLREQLDALAARLLRGYAFAPYSLHLAKNSSNMVRSVLGESGIVMSTMLTALLTVFADACVALLIAALLVAVQPLIAVGTIAVFALLSWFFYRAIRARVAHLSAENVAHGRAALRWVTQTLVGIKEIKVAGRETFFLAAAARYMRGSNAASQAITFMNNVPRYFNEGVAVVAMVLLAFALYGSGAPDVVPTLVLFAVAATRVIPSFNRMVTSLTSFRYGEAALRSVDGELRMLDATPAAAGAVLPGGASLRFESLQIADLRFRYRADAAFALELADLRIEPGRKVGFVGPSGSGKTTLVDLMLGLHRAPPGSVRINGRDVGEVLGAWRASVGYIPQSIFLLDDSIRRNVAFGLPDAEIDEGRVKAALAAARLDGLIAELPAGIDTEVGDRGLRLSGGQRQRIGIARALYGDPQVLILDEGTAALDNVTEAEIVRAIDALAGRKTVIMIAHRLSTVQNCDRIHFMQDGRIIAAGTYDELRDRLPEFQAMLNAGAAAAGTIIERAAPLAVAGSAHVSTNLTWHAGKVASAERRGLLGQQAATLWLTGLSASGKSTLAFELERRILAAGHACYVLDGDNIRHGLNRDLDFSPSARSENIRRIAEVARLFNEAGVIVITAFISPYRADRELARRLIGTERFVEVFVDAPLAVCEQRDPRGLYAKARAGAINDFTGVSAPYEVPEAPQLRLQTDKLDPGAAVGLLLEYVAGRCFEGK